MLDLSSNKQDVIILSELMEITSKTIIMAIVSVIIVAFILSGIFYLLKSSKQITPNLGKLNNPPSQLGVITASPTPTTVKSGSTSNQPAVASVNIKTYQGTNFTLKYPQNWGILTCSDSTNIEFDPYKKTDQLNFACDRAIKPITVIVSQSPISCAGETVKIGSSSVVRSKTETAYWLKNRWCVNKNGTSLDITNRVSSSGIVGTGKDDFSSEIEKIISFL